MPVSNKPTGRTGVLTASSAPKSLPPVATLLAVIAILYLGSEVFLPIALATLLTFALAPLVQLLRRLGLPRILAVILSVITAFLVVAALAIVVAVQVTDLANNLPAYQSNILAKVRTLKDFGAESGIVDRLSRVIERVGEEIEKEEPSSATSASPPDRPGKPIQVEVVAIRSPLQTLQSLLLPLLSPLATAGLVIVVVVFMLLEREALRDRFIRLVGYSDLHRTTEALQDAASRVGIYLLMQLVVNVTYAIPITIGLWLIGIPNAVLWGLLTMVLRFVPYIGPILGMLFPLLLAIAVAPGWLVVLWTVLLFLTVELISNNVVEPWLYGSRTGLSPTAIVVSALFWTWLWGPLGLVLSTPLTVCLSVLGRHVPQFEFLNILFGDEPVLEPEARLYQRLLAGDAYEATDQAEEFLEEGTLLSFYETVAIPAVLLGEQDRARGVMSREQQLQLSSTTAQMVENLTLYATELDESPSEETPQEGPVDELDLTGLRVFCVGGRTEIDEAFAAILSQVFAAKGATSTLVDADEFRKPALAHPDASGPRLIVFAYTGEKAIRHSLLLLRRWRPSPSEFVVGFVLARAPSSDNAAEPLKRSGAAFVTSNVQDTLKALTTMRFNEGT
jgi:predicted PurR-regulated permease PerM